MSEIPFPRNNSEGDLAAPRPEQLFELMRAGMALGRETNRLKNKGTSSAYFMLPPAIVSEQSEFGHTRSLEHTFALRIGRSLGETGCKLWSMRVKDAFFVSGRVDGSRLYEDPQTGQITERADIGQIRIHKFEWTEKELHVAHREVRMGNFKEIERSVEDYVDMIENMELDASSQLAQIEIEKRSFVAAMLAEFRTLSSGDVDYLIDDIETHKALQRIEHCIYELKTPPISGGVFNC